MNKYRRHFVAGGSGLVLATAFYPGLLLSENTVNIVMEGKVGGAHVWYNPYGLLIRRGQTVQWINKDPGNVHSATAYHPDIYARARRIPQKATAWDSGLLLPDESFTVTFEEEGVYDFYCLPHEHAGMVGRIIVEKPEGTDWLSQDSALAGIPDIALASFPSIDSIMTEKAVKVAI